MATCSCTRLLTRCSALWLRLISVRLFPPSDPKWKGADSAVFLREALKRVRAAGYGSRQCGLHAYSRRARKLARMPPPFAQHVAELLGVPVDCVGLKAKTPEGLGTENAAIANVVVLLEKKLATDNTIYTN